MVEVMEIKNVIIEFGNLEIFEKDTYETHIIEHSNGSGLYTCTDGERFTRSELKSNRFDCDINKIDEVLELLSYKESDKVYTDDGLNYIDQWEFDQLKEEWKADYYKVNFVINKN